MTLTLCVPEKPYLYSVKQLKDIDSVPSLTYNTIKTKLIIICMHFAVPDICNQNECLS